MSEECQIVVAQMASVVQASVVMRNEGDSHMEFNPLYTLTENKLWSWKR